MTRIRNLFILLLAAEILTIAMFVAWQWFRPSPPGVDLSRLPRSTAADVKRLQTAARSGQPNAWRELGEAYLAFGYFVEAEVCLRRAMVNRDDFEAAFAHASSLDRMGRTHEAHSQYEIASRLADPEMLRRCLYQLAQNHLRDEEPAEAERTFELIDTYAAADHRRARLLLFLGREAETRPLIARLEKKYPGDVHVQMLALRADRDAGQSASASDHADRAERSSSPAQFRLSDYVEYLHSIRSRYGFHAALAGVEAANQAGQLSNAAVQFEAIVQETDAEFLLDKLAIGADLELRAGRPREALRLLELLGDRMALPPPALHLMGDALQGIGETQRAREYWERANQLRPRAESLARLATLYASDGDAIRVKRQKGLAQQVAGIDAFRQNELSVALERLEMSVQSAPEETRTWFYLGEVRRLLSKPDLAAEAYRQCVALSPNHGRAIDRLASMGN